MTSISSSDVIGTGNPCIFEMLSVCSPELEDATRSIAPRAAPDNNQVRSQPALTTFPTTVNRHWQNHHAADYSLLSQPPRALSPARTWRHFADESDFTDDIARERRIQLALGLLRSAAVQSTVNHLTSAPPGPISDPGPRTHNSESEKNTTPGCCFLRGAPASRQCSDLRPDKLHQTQRT